MNEWAGGPAKVERTLRERDIQDTCVRWFRDATGGGYARKFSSPANRSVPDYILAFARYTVFVEFKAPGKKPTAAQLDEHQKIKAAGGTVWVIDNVGDFRVRCTPWIAEGRAPYEN